MERTQEQKENRGRPVVRRNYSKGTCYKCHCPITEADAISLEVHYTDDPFEDFCPVCADEER